MTKIQALLTGLLIIICTLLIFEVSRISYGIIYPQTRTWKFCEDKGYNFDGYYLEYEHNNNVLVKCYKYFVEGYKEEYFNATIDRFGKLTKYNEKEVQNE